MLAYVTDALTPSFLVVVVGGVVNGYTVFYNEELVVIKV